MLRRAVRYLAAALGAAIMINGIVMIIFANQTIGSYLTILLGLMFFFPAVFVKKTKWLLQYTISRIALTVIAGMFCLAALTTSFLAIYGNNNTVTYNEDYLLILGCGVHGTVPTEPLRSRLNTALEYLKSNSKCVIIVSGGQGSGEDISEAEAMREYLTEHGVENSRIMREDKSTSTSENFRFSNRMVDGTLSSRSTAFITNDFHIYRANSLSHLQGFNFTHMSAPTSWYNILPSYLREHLAIMKMIILNE